MTATVSPAASSLLSETVRGAKDTGRILALRWAALRSPLHRWGVLAAFVVLCVGLVSAANMGMAVKFMAMQGRDTAAGIFANTWILSIQRNEIGDIGAVTIGGALIAAVFAPFTGSATLSIIPTEDLNTIRPSRLHRYFDALAINAVSGIGLLQLLTLTGIASVLSIEGNRAPALAVTWLIWISVIALTTAVGWSLEWVTRRFGRAVRIAAGTVALALLAWLILGDSLQARRLYGLGPTYAEWMREAGSVGVIGPPAVGAIILTAIFMLIGIAATRGALNLPTTGNDSAHTRRAGVSRSSNLNTLTLLVNSLLRTAECRRPIIAILLLGLPAVFFVQITANIASAFMLAIPLAVSLAWGVNFFAVLSQGMPWLITQPNIPKKLPSYAFAIQAVIIVALTSLLMATAYVAGNATAQRALSVVTGSVVAALIASAVSVRLAIRHPIRARLSGRGDALVPPLTALGYLMLILVLAGLPAALTAVVLPPLWKVAAVGAAVVIAVAIQKANESDWSNRHQRAKVTAIVASN